MGMDSALQRHLATGATTLCRCWRLSRRDGRVFAFTDHDLPLVFDGQTWRPNEALSARSLEQTTGLSVDNSEAMGALSDAGLTEEDIAGGRFDGAEVEIWLVNWAAPEERSLQFRGSLGEIERAGGVFKAELRGLTEALNQPFGRLYQAPCNARLGDAACGFDLSTPGYRYVLPVQGFGDGWLRVAAIPTAVTGWFDSGRLMVETGALAGQIGLIRRDRGDTDGQRRLELWEALPKGQLAPGDTVRIEAGCDRRAESCRAKFDNIANFRGFPHMPTEDWLFAYPTSGGGQ